MTVGSWNGGNGQSGAYSLIRTKNWNGDDSIIAVTVPHPVRDPYGVMRKSTKWVFKEPYIDVKPPSSSTNVFDLVRNTVKYRDDLAAALTSEEAYPKLPSIKPGWNPSRKPKRARLKDNRYTMTARFEADFSAAFTVWGTTGTPGVCNPVDKTRYLYPASSLGGMDAWAYNAYYAAVLLDANDQIKLVNRLKEKLRGTDFNAAVFLGEGHQALGMIANAARRISGSLHALKKGQVTKAVKLLVDRPGLPRNAYESMPNFKRLQSNAARQIREAEATAILPSRGDAGLRRLRKELSLLRRRTAGKPTGSEGKQIEALKAEIAKADKAYDLSVATPKLFSSLWLEMVYGWLPLMKDAEEGAQFLAHHLNVPLQRTYRTSVVKNQRGRRETDLVWCPTYPVGKKIYGYWVKTHRRSLIARVRERESIPKLLGLTSLESVAWELVPWSFVVDWFMPIGDWLEARGFAQGLNATFVTSDKKMGESFKPIGAFEDLGNGSGFYPGYRDVSFDRTISTSLNVPMPTYKPLAKAASWRHCVNAVALLVSGHGGQGYK